MSSSTLCDFWCDTAATVIAAAGPENVHIVNYSEDLGTQEGSILDPDNIYAMYLKPRHLRMVETVKGLIGNRAKVCFHCRSSAYHFIPFLIEIGVDALNPAQVTARNMEPERLKQEFGDRLCFWGGINTQCVLPFGTADEVAPKPGK